MAVLSSRGVYLILPAHNEEQNIQSVLNLYTEYFTDPHDIFHVVVNNSTDKTFAVATAAAKKDKRIIVSHLTYASGKGGAILSALNEAINTSSTYVGFVDSDGSVLPTECQKLIKHLADRTDCDIAIASRWVTGASMPIKQSLLRRFLSRLFNVAIRSFFLFSYRDTQCGLKIMRRSVAKTLVPQLSETGFAFDVELLWRARQHNFIVAEVPITWNDVAGSSVKPLSLSTSLLRALWRIRTSK